MTFYISLITIYLTKMILLNGRELRMIITVKRSNEDDSRRRRKFVNAEHFL